MLRSFCLFLALTILPASARSQCCSLATASGHQWASDNAGGYGLFLGANQIGWMDKFGTYFPRLGKGQFGEATLPPIPAPQRRGECCGATACKCEPGDCQCGKTKGLCCDACTCAVNAQVSAPAGVIGDNFGVELDKLGKSPGYSKNGKPCSRNDVIQALEKGLVDDSNLPRLTVIGPKEAREKVLRDLDSSPALAPYKGKFLVQGYNPDNWAIQGLGFVTTGNPTIYAQKPDGVVLHRQDGYEGPEKLAQSLRKADPGYDPKKDPDLTKPSLSNIDLKNLPWPGIVIIGLALLLLFRKGE